MRIPTELNAKMWTVRSKIFCNVGRADAAPSRVVGVYAGAAFWLLKWRQPVEYCRENRMDYTDGGGLILVRVDCALCVS